MAITITPEMVAMTQAVKDKNRKERQYAFENQKKITAEKAKPNVITQGSTVNLVKALRAEGAGYAKRQNDKIDKAVGEVTGE